MTTPAVARVEVRLSGPPGPRGATVVDPEALADVEARVASAEGTVETFTADVDERVATVEDAVLEERGEVVHASNADGVITTFTTEAGTGWVDVPGLVVTIPALTQAAELVYDLFCQTPGTGYNGNVFSRLVDAGGTPVPGGYEFKPLGLTFCHLSLRKRIPAPFAGATWRVQIVGVPNSGTPTSWVLNSADYPSSMSVRLL